MRSVWLIVQLFYTLFLIPVLILFTIVLFGGSGPGPGVYYGVIVCSVMYFLFGALILKVIPDIFKAKLMKRIEKFKGDGFNPKFEALSSFLYSHYLGFDTTSEKLLFVDMRSPDGKLLNFDDINSWEMEWSKNSSTELKLLTGLPSIPVIKMPIHKSKTDDWKANLGMIFGYY